MLYLAQVQNSGSLIGRRTELKLLMRLKSGLVWSPLTEQSVLPAPDINRLHEGVLVLVELDAEGRVGRIQEATQLLIKTLQNFSTLQDKLRSQQVEIDAWKNSLIYQAQVLTRRAFEFEHRLAELRKSNLRHHPEQLKQLEYDYETLQLQRLEVTGARQKMEDLENEIDNFVQQIHEDLAEFKHPGP